MNSLAAVMREIGGSELTTYPELVSLRHHIVTEYHQREKLGATYYLLSDFARVARDALLDGKTVDEVLQFTHEDFAKWLVLHP